MSEQGGGQGGHGPHLQKWGRIVGPPPPTPTFQSRVVLYRYNVRLSLVISRQTSQSTPPKKPSPPFFLGGGGASDITASVTPDDNLLISHLQYIWVHKYIENILGTPTNSLK